MLPIVFAGVIGLCLGSFANVLFYRFPLGLSLLRPGSHCPHCGHAVRWRHNVPVLGWLILRGRCYDCGAPVSPQYPLVEALFGLLAVLVAWRFGPAPSTWVYLLFFEGLLMAAIIDWQTQYLPFAVTLPLAVLGFGVSFAFPEMLGGRWISPLSMAATWLGMQGLMVLGRWLFNREEALGGGDVTLMTAAAGFLGVKGVLLALFLGSILGIASFAAYSRSHGSSFWKDPGPFGPALALGSAIAAWDLLSGTPVLAAWLGFGPL